MIFQNIVAVGAGFIDALELGDNTKAAVIRLGLMEMVRFAQVSSILLREEFCFQFCYWQITIKIRFFLAYLAILWVKGYVNLFGKLWCGWFDHNLLWR